MVSKIVFNMDMINNIWKIMIKINEYDEDIIC